MRINSNVSALNTHRNMTATSNLQAKNLEKLSSGLDINRGADGPAKLQISEQLRAQTAGLKQAIDNSEMAVSVMQTAEAALDEVNRALVQARQLAVHAANTGTNDEFMQLADQQELNNILHQINTIAKNTQYGKKFLLDGSRSGNGITTGANLEFVSGGTQARSSGPGGHAINITKAATRSQVSGLAPLSQIIIDGGEQITITEGGRTVNFRTTPGQNVEQTMNQLSSQILNAGLNLDLLRPDSSATAGNLPQMLTLRHKEYGSEHSFQVATNTMGLLAKLGNVPDWIQNGVDVDGEIAGEEASGRGQVLTGVPGSGVAEGLSVRYTGENKPVEPTGFAGTVTFMQNSKIFQISQNKDHDTAMSFKSVRGAEMANFTRNQIMMESSVAMLAQANQRPLQILKLLQ